MKPESRQGLALAVAYCCGCLILSLRPLAPHDEGLLMYGFARVLGDSFFPCLFLQKLKPALALFYLPAARLGLAPYMAMHAVVAAATIFWMHEVARSLQHKRPWLPAFVVAVSPLFTWSAVTGVSNSDGVAATALFLYLLQARKNLFAAGFVLGMLPWIRYEQALFSAFLAPWVLYRTRSPRFLGGLVTWPIAYLGGGAIYHHDPIWFLHFLPGISNLDSGNPVWLAEFAGHDAHTAILSIAMVSPAVFVLPLLRIQRLSPIERLLAVPTLVLFVTFVVTHMSPLDIGPAFILGFSSRYAVAPLVGVALLLGRIVETHEVDVKARMRDSLLAAVLLVIGWFVRATIVVPLLVSATVGAFVAAMRERARKLGVTVILVLLVFLPLHLRDEILRDYPLQDASAELIAAWLNAHPPTGEMYTNHQLLVPYMVRTDHPFASRIKFMIATDHYFELVHLSNPANGQRAALLDAIPRSVFGSVVFPDDLDPDRVRPGTWFVLINDARTDQILPPERWKSRLKTIAETDWGRVYERLP